MSDHYNRGVLTPHIEGLQQQDSVATTAFATAFAGMRRSWLEGGLTPEEVENLSQPYRSFLLMMRDNDAEDRAMGEHS